MAESGSRSGRRRAIRRRAGHRAQVVRRRPPAGVLHAGGPPALPPLGPGRVPRRLARARPAEPVPSECSSSTTTRAARVHPRRTSSPTAIPSARRRARSEGLAALDEEPPDLILLDVMMPRMDGWEMLRRVHERHGVDAIPVIMFSGKVDEPGMAAHAARRPSSASRSTRSKLLDGHQAAASLLSQY